METYLRRIDPRTMDPRAKYIVMDGKEGPFETFCDFEFVAMELGIEVARVESLVASGKLTVDSMDPKRRSIALAEVGRCAVDMADEFSQWRYQDHMAKKNASDRAEQAELNKSKGERDAEQRAKWRAQRVGWGDRVPGAVEMLGDDALFFSAAGKVSLVSAILRHLLDGSALDGQHVMTVDAAWSELVDVRALIDEIQERVWRGEFKHAPRKRVPRKAA